MKIPNFLISVTSGNTLKVACKLYSLIDWNNRSKNGFEVCIKQNTIASSCGLSLSTVKRALNELERKNVITNRYRVTNKNGYQGTYHYSLEFFNKYFELRYDVFKLGLSAQEFTLYAAMCKLRTNRTSSFYQSLNDLCRITNLDKSNICKLYKKLSQKRLVCKQLKRTKAGDYTDNTYFVVIRKRGKLSKKAPAYLLQNARVGYIVPKGKFFVNRKINEFFVNSRNFQKISDLHRDFSYAGGSG